MTLTPASILTASELAEAARLSEERGFEGMYRLHARYVAGVVFRIVGHDGDLDDVVQETFVAASSHLNQLRDPAAIRPWLVAIAIRCVKSHLSRRRRQRILALQIAGFTARTSDPHDRRAVDEIYDVLDRLSPDLRIPWVLARIEQFTLPEVARLCNLSLTSVKRRIVDAEERIQRRLGK